MCSAYSPLSNMPDCLYTCLNLYVKYNSHSNSVKWVTNSANLFDYFIIRTTTKFQISSDIIYRINENLQWKCFRFSASSASLYLRKLRKWLSVLVTFIRKKSNYLSANLLLYWHDISCAGKKQVYTETKFVFPGALLFET